MSTITETKIENIKLENIFPSTTNPRKSFDEKGLQELADSITEHGILQPILVRPIPDSFDKDGMSNYEIIYGERRYRASKLAGITTIKAQIEYMDDDKAFEIQVLENLQREDINPLDEARAFQSLMKKETFNWLASKINKSKKYVLDRVKLLDLCPAALTELENGVLPLGHAVLLSKIDIEKQEKVIKASNLFLEKRISDDVNQVYCAKTLSQLKEYIAGTMLSFDRVNFDLDDADLIPKAGSCQSCPKRTINQNLLFGDITENDMCTDSFCFDAKIRQQVDVNVKKAKVEFGDIQTAETDKWSSRIILSDTKEKVSYNKEKTERYKLPVVITKTDNYGLKDMGRTVWIEEKEVEEIKTENKPSVPSDWELRQAKEFNEITIPRFKELISECIDKPFAVTKISNSYLTERFAQFNLKNLLVIAYLLEITPIENLSYSEIKAITNGKTREEDFEMCFEIAKQIVAKYSVGLALSILAIEDLINNDFEENESVSDWELTINKVYSILKLSTGATVEEIETESEEVNIPVDSIEELENTLQEEIGEGSSAVTPTLDIPTFHKIVTKKRYALNNSYFKNRLPSMPANPLEVMYYFTQHGELPFDMGSDTDNWLYECYVEYQKRAGVYGSQFFTPPATAKRIAELAFEYFNNEEAMGTNYPVTDMCSGFGMLSKPLVDLGFKPKGYDFSSEMIELYAQYAKSDCRVFNFEDDDKINGCFRVVSNPPYEVPKLTKFFERLHSDILADKGKAIILLPKGFMQKQKPKALVEILEKFDVIHQEDMDEEFARTKINAEIVVLKKV